MIAKNEEKFLPDCLNSVKDLVDEIIIVDTGSTDRTVEIAKSFGAKVFHVHWDNDFSKPRNKSLEQATKDWILFLDLDEIIAKEDFEKIKSAIKTKNSAYSMKTRNYIHEKKPFLQSFSSDDIYSDYNKGMRFFWYSTKVRLFPNNKKIKFVGVVHEMVEKSLKKEGFQIKPLDVPIHHYNQLDKEKSREKRFFYLNISKKKLECEPKNPKAYLELGREYFSCKMHHRAIFIYKRGLIFCKERADDDLKSFLLCELGLAYKGLKKYLEAKKYLYESLKIKPGMKKSLEGLNSIPKEKIGVLILCYHDVSESKIDWCITIQNFEKQILTLIKNGYEFVTLDYFISKKQYFSKKLITLTFDDGRKSVYTEAFPLLKKLGIKATAFITTDWIEGKNISQKEQYSDFMNWDEIKELSKNGWVVGSHGKTHKDLRFVDEKTLKEELEESKKVLEKNLGKKVLHFAYPYGSHNPKIQKEALKNYETLSTILSGFANKKNSLNRTIITKNSSITILDNQANNKNYNS